jgi:hypothetical protein
MLHHHLDRRHRPHRSRSWLALSLVVLILACEEESPPPAYAEPAQQQEDGAGGDPSQMQDIAVGAQPDDYADTDPSALTDFHATLDPHGTWVDDPEYGTVWVPNVDEVGADFAPYVSNGGWAYDDDYVWESYYAWGWAPFHYGRWTWSASGHWAWIPGRTYAGAWVTWRVGPEGYGYVGWGPRAPGYIWRGGVAMTYASTRPGPVVFCGRDDLFARGVAGRVVVGPRASTLAAETRPFVGASLGPAPVSLGIRADAVVRVGASDRGVAQARAFARPASAQAMGAHPPRAHVVRTARPRPVAAPAYAPRAAPAPRAPSGGGGHRR